MFGYPSGHSALEQHNMIQLFFAYAMNLVQSSALLGVIKYITNTSANPDKKLMFRASLPVIKPPRDRSSTLFIPDTFRSILSHTWIEEA